MSSPTRTKGRAQRERPGDRPTTPAMRQYARFKAMHPECVLFFRMGDFYEMFHEDAVLAHKALGITLTQRTEGIPMAGVPHHAVENYLRRMIDAGYRVAVCDQVQDPKEATGVVDRAVTRVLTPGTLVDEALLDEGRTNHVAALVPAADGRAAALAVIELSTGSFWLLDVPAGRVVDEVVRIGPAELLYPESADGVPAAVEAVRAASGCALTARPPWTFRPQEAGETLREHFGVATLTGFGLADDDPVLGAAGAVLRYLQETQTPGDGAGSPRLKHLRPPRRRADDAYVTIDAATLHNLEIERTMRAGTVADSLLSIFGRCRTGMGQRLLRHWLCFPLRDRAAIETRQRMVADLVDDPRFAAALAEALGGIQDVARIVGRVSMRRATPRDVVALGNSAAALPAVAEQLDNRPAFDDLRDRLAGLAADLGPLAEMIIARCVDAPPAHLREGGLFRDGVDPELDEARTLQRDANGWLAEYQKRLVDESGIPSLKVGYNKVFGYYIEITHAHADKVPAAFSRKQTLKNAERYITPDLKTFEDKVTTASAEAVEREKFLFEELNRAASDQAPALLAYADLVGELDVAACFADTARRNNYARPQLIDEPGLDIRQGRHPVLDRTLGERFVPNDCRLGAGAGTEAEPTLALITGPNMAGKSTYIRQIALIVLLAHAGSFVPAESAVIGLTDRIFTRIGASDELHAGRSTFMVEMTETANILHHATDRSLVILDEIGRGTSTLDGLSLAWAITEALARRGCRTLFATHYHELTALADDLDGVANLHVSVREWGEQIIFLYRILPGRTDRSYGIHVARIAGLPGDTVDRATAILETLAVQTEAARPEKVAPAAQLSLFKEYLQHPVIDALRGLEINQLSPLEAFDVLRRLREQADQEGQPAAMGAIQTDILLQRARKAHAQNNLDQARRFCEEILQRQKNHGHALFLLGQIAFAQNRLDDAATYMQRALAVQPRNPVPRLTLAEVRTYQGRYDDAVTEYDLVLKADPDNAPAIAGKADAYEKSGRRDKARALLQPVIAEGRENAMQAIIQARLDLHDKNYDAVVALIHRHLQAKEAQGVIRWHLNHHLGQALERMQRYDEAFAAYETGNGIVPTHFDRDTWAQAVDELLESFSPDRFAAVPRAAHGSALPVFVLGMPRSGSTLIETIVSAHPEAAAGGELPHMQLLINSISLDIGSSLPYPACIEDLEPADVDTIAGRYLDLLRESDATAGRIVDKYLTNFRHLGMLAVLFPEARIIHCRRHPLDTCFSCFQTPLSPATHPWALDLANIGAMYVGYERLMTHWRDVLEIPMLEIQYEELVADQEGHTRRIIDFCGLEWDDRCLRFYEGDRVVLTASYDQVNRPIYSSSMGRHRHFAQHLGPLKSVLAEGGVAGADG